MYPICVWKSCSVYVYQSVVIVIVTDDFTLVLIRVQFGFDCMHVGVGHNLIG